MVLFQSVLLGFQEGSSSDMRQVQMAPKFDWGVAQRIKTQSFQSGS